MVTEDARMKNSKSDNVTPVILSSDAVRTTCLTLRMLGLLLEHCHSEPDNRSSVCYDLNLNRSEQCAQCF